MSSLKVLLPDYILKARGLVKLGILYDKDLDFYLWRRILAAKIDVCDNMYLMADMSTDTKRKKIPITFGLPPPFLCLS